MTSIGTILERNPTWKIFSKNITNIRKKILRGEDIQNCAAAERMSWVSRRLTTRVEDEAYCLMGIFDVNMPLL